MCLNCECQELDCDKINIDSIVGILFFEKVDELTMPEAEQVKDLYHHIEFCDNCSSIYKNLIDDTLYDDENPDMVVFKNFSENLLKLKGPYVHPPIIDNKNEL